METKNTEVQRFILEQAQLQNIPKLYIDIIKDNYYNNPRALEDIKKEIKLLFTKLSTEGIRERKQEYQKSVNSDSEVERFVKDQSPLQTSTILDINNNASIQEKINMSTFDNVESVNQEKQSRVILPTSINSQDSSTGEELNSMFDLNNQASLSQNTSSIAQSNSKGKAYVKSNGKSILFDDNGFSNLMNISFILTIITILGIFLATIIILINKA